MKITLTKSDVMGILCDHFNISHSDISTIEKDKTTEPFFDEVYWEGNPEIKKEN